MREAAHSGRSMLGIPAAALAALPLCPACYPAYAGILSALGLGVLASVTAQALLTTVLLAAALASLVYRARARRGYGPFLLGVLAAGLIAVSKFALGIDALTYAAVAALVGAGVWNLWPSSAATCPGPDAAELARVEMKGL